MHTAAVLTLIATGAYGQPAEKAFPFRDASTVQERQEIATVIRSVGEIRQLIVDQDRSSLVVTGEPWQLELAGWLFQRLDGDFAGGEYRIAGDEEGVVRVFYLNHAPDVRDLQEVATIIRSIGDVRRLFTYNKRKGIAVRGTEEQMRLAEWLVSRLDRAAEPSRAPAGAEDEYRLPADEEGIVRILYTPAESVQSLQRIAVNVRTTTGIRRLFTCNRLSAVVARGTRGQIDQAARLAAR